MTTKTKAIRALNDELRQNFATGIAVMTAGVAALGAETVSRIVKTIGVYDNFCHANDPYEEHDFGVFEIDGHKLFFKIDYYDKSRSYHSPDPRSFRHRARDYYHVGGGVLKTPNHVAPGEEACPASRTPPAFALAENRFEVWVSVGGG
jgi:Protein of unknown function (DUF3768)